MTKRLPLSLTFYQDIAVRIHKVQRVIVIPYIEVPEGHEEEDRDASNKQKRAYPMHPLIPPRIRRSVL